MSSFEEANKKVHKVEDQWHYPIMTAAGFTAETKEGIGFVRNYKYKHPSGLIVNCATGVNADHWNAVDDNNKQLNGGYWSSLEAFLKTLS